MFFKKKVKITIIKAGIFLRGMEAHIETVIKAKFIFFYN